MCVTSCAPRTINPPPRCTASYTTRSPACSLARAHRSSVRTDGPGLVPSHRTHPFPTHPCSYAWQVVAEEAADSYNEAIVHQVPSNTLADMEANVARVVAWAKAWRAGKH